MNTYEVTIYEVHGRILTVQAAGPDEAKEIANKLIESGDAAGTLEYLETKDRDYWLVDRVG